MSAQVISFAAFARSQKRLQREFQQITQANARAERIRTVAARRRRGMTLNEVQAAVLARLNRGETITSMGQIDKPTQRMLDRLTKKGWLIEGRDCTFPAIKRCWAARGLLEEVEEGLAELSAGLKF